MYRLIFYFFYRYFLNRNDRSPTFGAICGVFLAIGLQFILVYVLVQRFIGSNLLNPISETYAYSKLFSMLIAIPFLFLNFKFFHKRRTDDIINHFDNKENVFSVRNWILFVSLTILPLALIILLLKK